MQHGPSNWAITNTNNTGYLILFSSTDTHIHTCHIAISRVELWFCRLPWFGCSNPPARSRSPCQTKLQRDLQGYAYLPRRIYRELSLAKLHHQRLSIALLPSIANSPQFPFPPPPPQRKVHGIAARKHPDTNQSHPPANSCNQPLFKPEVRVAIDAPSPNKNSPPQPRAAWLYPHAIAPRSANPSLCRQSTSSGRESETPAKLCPLHHPSKRSRPHLHERLGWCRNSARFPLVRTAQYIVDKQGSGTLWS